MSEPIDLVDTHAHLCDDAFGGRLDDVLATSAAAGVRQIVVVATTARDSFEAVALADRHRGLFAAVGIHPNHAAEERDDDWLDVADLARRPRVVAIGETGLDRYRDHAPFPLQEALFERHLELAEERDLPVLIHCRQSEGEIARQLRGRGGPVRGVLHSFTGGPTEAEAFLDLGLHLSFAGMVSFTNRSLDALRAVAATVPADRLLVETDSPYLSPHPLRGRTNQPAHLVHTAQAVAAARGITPDELADLTTRNARRLFGLDPTDRIGGPVP